ncbi:MAG: ABC transporter permease, partial [Steroidobacteraceae bacterium]
LWQRPGATALVLFPRDGQSRDALVEEVRSRTADGENLFFTYGPELRRALRDSIDRFFVPLYAIAALALTLGAIAVASLLIGAVVERRRDFSLLRVTGASGGNLAAIVMIDGWLVVIAACSYGLALGVACSFPLVDLLNDAYGWSLDRAYDPWQLAALGAGAFLLATLAALYPAWSARRSLPVDVFAPQ